MSCCTRGYSILRKRRRESLHEKRKVQRCCSLFVSITDTRHLQKGQPPPKVLSLANKKKERKRLGKNSRKKIKEKKMQSLHFQTASLTESP
jgi:hypothetical protein